MYELVTLGTCDLRHPDGRSVQAVLAQPKRLALLAVLALAHPRGFVRRDVLLPLFWPELDEERARAALRRAVYFLRQALGKEAIASRGDDELGIGEAVIRCDTSEFEALLGSGHAAEALRMYGGDLLPGLHLHDAPEFERWLDSARDRLRRRAVEAAWLAVEQAEREREADAALAHARRAVELSQNDEIAVRRLLALHHRVGDARGGLAAFDAYRQQLHEEYGIAPSAELVEQAQALADSSRPRRGPSKLDIMRARMPFAEAAARAFSLLPDRRVAQYLATAAVAMLLLLGLYAFVRIRERGDRVVLAVGAIRDFTGDSASQIARSVPDLLATNLGRSSDLQLVSIARLYELLGARASDPGALATAARSAGATHLIEGALYRASGAYRLDVREVDLEDGDVHAAFSVEAADIFTLVDRATAQLYRPAGALRVADVTTPSAEAWNLYQEALREFHQRGNLTNAYGLFISAIKHDSLFAMAHYYASFSAPRGEVGLQHLEKAEAASVRASEHDRLLIRATLQDRFGQPSRLAIAESLAARYPARPDGHYLVGNALLWGGDFLGSIPYYQRVIELDSMGLRGDQPRCRGCDAYAAITLAYAFADSIDAALRVARRFVAIKPGSSLPWEVLSAAEEAAGNIDASLAALRRVLTIFPDWGGADAVPVRLALRSGDFTKANALLESLLHGARPTDEANARWFGTTAARYQGRLDDALRSAKQYRRLDTTAVRQRIVGYNGLLQGIALFESGRYRESAALFDSIAALQRQVAHPRGAPRPEVWALAHAANALAYAGDTASLPAQIDRIRELGAQSAYGRDQKLHHHVRGLLLRARGDLNGAALAFREGIFSPTGGYTRTNYELARTLLDLNRPAEAVGPLQSALRGGLDSSNLYMTHTELHELLGRAFDQLGKTDSARVHYQWVVRAWERADPPWQIRRAALEQRLRSLN